uniref:Ig-like domain-containing protein n=1 Tax=Erpetoichthys calabaricus TaxID=27687 RepID=A0A8C4X4U9_ERPCA
EDTLIFLFILITCCVHTEITLKESDPATVLPGQTHTLSCKASGFTFSSYYMYWIRQPPGKGLEWVAGISNGGGGSQWYAPSVQGRFIISRDDSNSLLYLNMKNLETTDTAKYYCAKDAQ